MIELLMIELLWVPVLLVGIIGCNKLLDWLYQSAVEHATKVLTQNAAAITVAKPVQSMGVYRNNAFGPGQDPALFLKTTEELLALSRSTLDRVDRDLVKVREIHEVVQSQIDGLNRSVAVVRRLEPGYRKRILLK